MTDEPLTNEKYRAQDEERRQTVQPSPNDFEWQCWRTYCLNTMPEDRLSLVDWLTAHRLSAKD